MNWSEFKQKVETAGVKDNTEIDYIDITGFDFIECEVYLDILRNEFNVH